ncbi:MAG: hypothetical protein CNCCGFBP_02460 [Fimbriimonadaceae bacterium]|nr:hypothetical protein [Fimbriimonadaceae bacterium]
MSTSSGNRTLASAKAAKQDEFYTQLSDIANELKHYKDYFKGKVVLCNCDDPFESNFFKYFAANFNTLGLKKLVTTSYAGSPIVGGQLPLMVMEGLKPYLNPLAPMNGGERGQGVRGKPRGWDGAHLVEINEVPDLNQDGAINLEDVEHLLRHDRNVSRPLEQGGDFRSPECVEVLNAADIVVTNPPFSLFREYVAQLVEHGKQFLIIGNVNAIKYKVVFPLIKENKLWLGPSIHSGDREFRVPDYYPLEAAGFRVDENGVKYIRVKGVRWFTNMDFKERHQDITLFKKYSPEAYPAYDNYDAIEVGKVADIPEDYEDTMGIPITFLDKYNPDQFEVIWQASGNTRASAPSEFLAQMGYRPHRDDRGGCAMVDGKRMYDRIFIKRKREGLRT